MVTDTFTFIFGFIVFTAFIIGTYIEFNRGLREKK